ncbi:hypothetical protein AALO_G00265240 [Alosa alosa]|uniref:Schlafen AlbA-2 domain-containing protein n=2 Tax=Alosa alosa TaxID=278164 RepID=A0AAV6FL94_9TELE|nr:schlafen family member 13-like isoform X1 [Alosa alosa]XP_048087946.1 schlafen family member 13-like isoform X1 [Alosa alosa]XP_048087947.1 schlafen family member 13-like isoform X1 [Alosa alosa]KAG5263475.1 hypothetical protein AALO_G00265240 [Alosa alosa]
MASRGLTVTDSQDFPDIEIKWSAKVTLGESARNQMDKKKRDRERECILYGICALLNSGGGVFTLDIANSYNYRREGRGLDIEQHLLDLVGSPFEDMIECIPQGDKVHIYVRSWHCGSNRSRLCSIDTGLRERAGSTVNHVSPRDVSEFLSKRKDRANRNRDGYEPRTSNDIIKNCAEKFYMKDSVEKGKCLEFGESTNVELKEFRGQIFTDKFQGEVSSSENLIKRLKEVVPKMISAFANTDGGFLFNGINDKSKEVTGCGSGIDAGELLIKVKDVCKKAKAIHTSDCNKDASWSPECRLIKVTAQESSEADAYVVAIKIPVFCCAVFEKDPNSLHIEGGTVCRLGATVWMKKMQLSDPDADLSKRFLNVLSLRDAPPQCKSVYSIEMLTHLQEKLFPVPTNNIEVMPDAFKNKPLSNAILIANSSKSPGICIFSPSWAVDIDLPKNKDVIREALIISTGSYPTLCCVVKTDGPDLWKYATNTAFHLKQKLVNVGGYTGKLCVIPQLVNSQNWTVLNHPSLYPNSYRLNQEKDVKALLRSLVIVVMSFTSPLSDEIGCEFLNLLTEEQFKILQTYGAIKNNFIHGVPGSGKTLIAMVLIRRIKNLYCCEEKNILYLCENFGLRSFMREQNICQCETRVKFLDKHTDFSAVKHIIVDEAQNFRVEEGESNWYEKALKLRGADGMFWVFLDYYQKCHDFPDGLPPLSNQHQVILCKVVRNSANVLKAMQCQMHRIMKGPQSEVTQHLKNINSERALHHSFQGSCTTKEVAPDKVVKCVTKILERLLDKGHTAGDIAVLFSTQEQLTEEKDKLTTQFPLFRSVEKISQKVMVDSVCRFSGLERNIVILVNPSESVHPRLKHLKPNLLISAYSIARIELYVVKSKESVWLCRCPTMFLS